MTITNAIDDSTHQDPITHEDDATALREAVRLLSEAVTLATASGMAGRGGELVAYAADQLAPLIAGDPAIAGAYRYLTNLTGETDRMAAIGIPPNGGEPDWLRWDEAVRVFSEQHAR
ncbi:MAG TPA: hypothetical protein VEL07_19870 [Planctomycetota bacterium]|nr:hypothetical protein [Planctomycetota bacterium]